MSESPSQQRSKRQKIDKHGRFAALEKLRNLNGAKHKYKVDEEVDNVFDTVDEKEYAKHVLSRAKEDWIEDDGTGYVEDGREIFDEEDEYKEINSKAKKKQQGGRKRLRDINDIVNEKRSIKSSIKNFIPKKKEAALKLDEDDILADILGEMDTKTNDKSKPITKSNNNEDISLVKDYIQNFSKNIKKSNNSKANEEPSKDDILIEKLLKSNSKRAAHNFNLTKTESNTTLIVEPKPQYKKIEETEEENSQNKCNEIEENLLNNMEIENEDKIEILSKNNSILTNELRQSAEIKKKETDITTNENENLDAYINNINMDNWDDNIFSNSESEKINIEIESAKPKSIANYDDLLTGWENFDNIDIDDITSNNANEVNNLQDSSEIKFWLWDAWENSTKRPGEIFLFGKVSTDGQPKAYQTTCVHIEGIQRCIYLLPREYMLDPITNENTNKKVTMEDVYSEFNESISTTLQLTTFRWKVVTKQFVFDVPNVEVPFTSEYIEIRYDAKKPPPKLDPAKPYKTIAHIFGTNGNPLESFLLDCKIKGPCWLNIRNYTVKERSLSWCKLEISCLNPNSISVSEAKCLNPPPLVIVSLNVITAINRKTTKNEVVMLGCLINNQFSIDKPLDKTLFQQHFCGVSRPSTQNWPKDFYAKLSQYKATKVLKFDSERALLSWFLATLKLIDPDLIVSHDSKDCQLDTIVDRVQENKIPMWSRIGRLNMSNVVDSNKKMENYIGRLICDIKECASELLKLRSYDLNTLCTEVLKMKEDQRMDISNDQVFAIYESGDGILKLITLIMQDSLLTLKLMCELNILPLALQISNICGNLLNLTLQGGRSRRNEFLLLHAFVEKNYIVPDRRSRETFNYNKDSKASSRKKAKFAGGLVLDPVKGFYEQFVLLMDFNSLYPSIIQEYNICFTTITKPDNEDEMPVLPDSSVEQGLLPQQIRRLVESRREVKKLMKSPHLDEHVRRQYGIREQALKLTANSMYGCLGYAQSRFPAQHLAALVTQKGRDILMNTKNLVQKMNYEVIYGDTDSLMVNTNLLEYDKVHKIGYSIKQSVNKMYNQVELEIDGVYKNFLLIKKKKYAALKVSEKNGTLVYTQEHKGLDMVRRDWSPIAKMTAKHVLDELFSEISFDDRIANIHEHLVNVKEEIVNNRVPLPLYAIAKQITRDFNNYSDNIKSLSHIQVALRMNASGSKRFKPGDTVEYIICNDGTENPSTQRAYHMDEIKNNEKLKVDLDYYLSSQIHPMVMRLCEPICDTDAVRIAMCLGLDAKKFKTAALKMQNERDETVVNSKVQKFRNCDKFTFKCPDCETVTAVSTLYVRDKSGNYNIFDKCSNEKCSTPPNAYISSIQSELLLSIEKYVNRYYEKWMVCSETICGYKTRFAGIAQTNKMPICRKCKKGSLNKIYSESDLYYQILHFQYIFDIRKYDNIAEKSTPESINACNLLYTTVTDSLNTSNYQIIRLSGLFCNLRFDQYNFKISSGGDALPQYEIELIKNLL